MYKTVEHLFLGEKGTGKHDRKTASYVRKQEQGEGPHKDCQGGATIERGGGMHRQGSNAEQVGTKDGQRTN